MHRNRIHGTRRMAVWTGLLTVLVLAASPALAQERMRDHDPEEHLAKLQEELNLDAQQTEQIRAIFAEQHAKFQALREETHARIQEVLNDEQRARLEELHAEFKERHGHGPMGHGDHKPKDAPDTD
ncbi:MAG TPA: hypothetical protein VFG78_00115 [Gemmatimonadota bacterium]|nr:hypothetical protein [Gemmatimonadota bacterium]